MRKELHNLKRYTHLVALALLMAGCTLHKEPEMTATGELGIDPTEVTLDANLTLNINLSDKGNPSSTRMVNSEYQYRFIVEAYLNRQVVARQVFTEEITERTHLSLPVSMKLHARKYQLVVWSDYVKAETQKADLYYKTESLVPLIGADKYTGNTEYKDAFAASVEVDLTRYRNEWGAKVPVDIELHRPVARYELIANDVASFLRKVKNGEVTGSKFTARIKYSNYLPVGYNVLDDVPKHSLMYMQYTKSFSLPAEGTQEFSLAFDYVFVNSGEATYIPVEVEIVNEESKTVANTVVRIPGERNKNTIIRGAFLTANPNGGVGFDPEYDGEINVDVEISPIQQ